MSDEDDWEKYADDDIDVEKVKAEVNPIAAEKLQAEKLKEQQQQKQSKAQQSLEKSKQSDMQNVFDLFGVEGNAESTKKLTNQDLQRIGESFATKLNNSTVSPLQTKEFLKTFIQKLDKKMDYKQWEEVYKCVEELYTAKKKQHDQEEAKYSKKGGVPKGVKWGKPKGQMDLNDDEVFDDDDFM